MRRLVRYEECEGVLTRVSEQRETGMMGEKRWHAGSIDSGRPGDMATAPKKSPGAISFDRKKELMRLAEEFVGRIESEVTDSAEQYLLWEMMAVLSRRRGE